MDNPTRVLRQREGRMRIRGACRPSVRRATMLLLLPLLLAPTGATASQEPDSAAQLSLGDAIERALAAHPAVGIARARNEGAAATRGEARAARYPTLRVAGSAMKYEEPMLVTPIRGFEPGQAPAFDRTLIQGGASLQYSLFDARRGALVRQTVAGAAAAGAAVAEAEQALTVTVVASYLTVLGRAQVLEAHDHRLAALRAEYDRVGQFRAAGRAAQVEVLRVEAALAGAEAERVQIGSALDVAERDLARLVGTSVEETRALRLQPVGAADTVVADRESLLAEALHASPAIELARRELAAAEAGHDVARNARWPALDLVVNYLNRGSSTGDFQSDWNAGVQFSFPLFTGGAVRSRVAQADAASRAAAAQHRLATLDVEHELDRALASMEEARARAASLETAVARSAEVARTEKLALGAGSGVQTDYLAAEAELLNARANLAEARNAMVFARVELGRALGQLDSGWVARALGVQP